MMEITKFLKSIGVDIFEVHGITKFDTFWAVPMRWESIEIRPKYYGYTVTVYHHYPIEKAFTYKLYTEGQVIKFLQDEYNSTLV